MTNTELNKIIIKQYFIDLWDNRGDLVLSLIIVIIFSI